MLGFNKYYIVFFLFIYHFGQLNSQTTYYVNDAIIGETGAICSAAGATGNTGLTPNSPKANISEVLALGSINNATIIVDIGNYTEINITPSSDDYNFTIQGVAVGGVLMTSYTSSSNGNWLFLNNYQNDNVTVKKIKFVSSGNSTAYLYGGGFIRAQWQAGTGDLAITGLTIDSCYVQAKSTGNNQYGGAVGLFCYGTTDLTITNSTFTNCQSHYFGGAVSVLSTNNIATLNCTKVKFIGNQQNYNYGSAVYISSVASGGLATFTNCLLYDNVCNGGSGSQGVIYTNGANTNLTMWNCTVANNTASSGYTGGVYTYNSSSVSINNCIFKSNTYKDVYESGGSVTLNNCFYENEYHTTLNSCSTLNPLFTNQSGRDYTLQSTSTAIDAGKVLGAPSDDILSNARTVIPDIGAFEHGGGATPLPINLDRFIGLNKLRHNLLIWGTKSETNNLFFQIEKSTNGVDFYEIGFIKGCGNCNYENEYQFPDYNLEKTINYYRLKQVDFDGKYIYSKIITIDNRFSEKKEIKLICNILGQPVESHTKGWVFIYYNDGSLQKIMNH